MNPIVRKSMSTLLIQPSFRALGQVQVKWQTFENPEKKRQMYGSQSTQAKNKFMLISNGHIPNRSIELTKTDITEIALSSV